MMRNYNAVGPGPSQSTGSMISSSQMSMGSMQGYPQEPPVNLASKVAEVFLTAGHAFQKLGDLTLQLHSTVEPEECKWNEKDVDQLRDSLTRFAHELDMISQSVQGRTTKLIKTDIKRRQIINDEARRPASPGVKRPLGVGGPPTKRVNVVPSSGPKTMPVTRTVVPISSMGQRIPISHAQMQQQSAPLLNDPSQYQYSS